MPLKVIRRRDTGGTLWITGTVRPAGAQTGVRIRRRAGSDREDAAREEAAALEASILREAWHGPRAAVCGFAVAVRSYIEHEARSAGTLELLARLVRHFADTPLDRIDQLAVDRARAIVLRPGAAPGTVRRNLIVPLSAVMKHAAKRGWCQSPTFDLPREPKGRTTFLLPHQVEALTAAAAPHLRPLITFLVSTGCRTGEALALDWSDVDLQAARVILWEGATKSGDRRVIHLHPAAVVALANLKHRQGRVFLDRRRRPYGTDDSTSRSTFRTAWATACNKAGLPGNTIKRPRPDRASQAITFKPDHTPHCLRHTWATWHYALNRDLLLLTRDGGWSTTALVERYAHIMPSGQESAIRRVWGCPATDTKGNKAVA